MRPGPESTVCYEFRTEARKALTPRLRQRRIIRIFALWLADALPLGVVRADLSGFYLQSNQEILNLQGAPRVCPKEACAVLASQQTALQ